MNRLKYFADGRPSVITTVEDYNDLVRRIQADDETWFQQFIGLCKHYYEQEPVGGPLHIVLDDNNIENENIAWCEGYAFGLRDMEGTDIASLMRMMTMEQRRRVVDSNHLYA